MIEVRKAVHADAEAILRLIDALAGYEKLDPPGEAAKQRLIGDMFADRPRIECFLAESGGVAAGYTLCFETYSSFLGLPTFFLEDFFVLPQFRGQHVGSALFRAMIREAHRRGCGRMEWSVLNWNQLAIDFYERFAARRLDEWLSYRFTREDMDRLLIGS